MTLRYYQAVIERKLVKLAPNHCSRTREVRLAPSGTVGYLRDAGQPGAYMECVAEGHGIWDEVHHQIDKHDDDWNDLHSCIRSVKRLPPLRS